MTSLRHGRPIWIQGSRRIQRYSSLSGVHRAQVAIIGGGMTGALAAHAFAAAGVEAILLEAGLAGRGSTAASSALLLQEPDLELSELDTRYGARASRRIWEMSGDSVESLVRLLRRLKIGCGLERKDAIYYAADAKAGARLRAEFEHRRASGFEGIWLGSAALRNATGISGYGAIRSSGNAQFDPYRACLGVLRAAAASGAQIFERSRVTRVVNASNHVRVFTENGRVDCDRVIIATGYATPHFRPLVGRFRMYRTYVVATKPLTVAERREAGLSDVMVWDTERSYHYARWAFGHRLLLGGGDQIVRPGARRAQQFEASIDRLRAYFETRFPALSSVETESAWEGMFATTPDTLPYIGPHRRYPRHWFALGYGGNGMTFGFLAARLLLERWQGNLSKDHALFEFGRHEPR
jgi:glycine/D-amino acid oxidase-like deaminating enzyme